MQTIERKLPETQRRTRGHAFSPPQKIARRIPALYETDGVPAEEKTIWIKFFSGAWTWYVAEIDWESGEAFGFEVGPGGEGWTYIDLPGLEGVRPRARGNSDGSLSLAWVVERDCFFKPAPFAQARGN